MVRKVENMIKKCLLILTMVTLLTACGQNNPEETTKPSTETHTQVRAEATTETTMNKQTETTTVTEIEKNTEVSTQLELEETPQEDKITSEKISLNPSWKYADYSAIHSGSAILYRHKDLFWNGVTVCINAGHGTEGGESVKTLCHPDGSPKVTGGTTPSGATKSYAISSGMSFPDGTSEAEGVSIFSDGDMEMDLTQTSFSTIPSIDLEVGDAGSDLSEKNQTRLAEGILKGLNKYYKKGAD